MSIAIEELSSHWNLTEVEKIVVHLLVTGTPNSTIARELSRSIKTVEAHITRILKKAECSNRIELMVRAMALTSHASGTIDMRDVAMPTLAVAVPPQALSASA
ncbi:MAG: LuxR C-terminal-related transcriptional regulator [Polyangiaceae bacterium]|nr:LuxR C-terminal-related transcriptional regulator [Polyangiaceae bacterium]